MSDSKQPKPGTLHKIPADYPNPYFHDHNQHKFPTVTFIRYAVTPTGKRGADFEQFRVYLKPNGKHEAMTNEAIIEEAQANTQPKRLKPGYAWGELFVHHDFTDRKFVAPAKFPNPMFTEECEHDKAILVEVSPKTKTVTVVYFE